jgi:hypothetical protein
MLRREKSQTHRDGDGKPRVFESAGDSRVACKNADRLFCFLLRRFEEEGLMCRGNRCGVPLFAVLVLLLGIFVCIGSQALATSIAGDTISATWYWGAAPSVPAAFFVPQTLTGWPGSPINVSVTDGQVIVEAVNAAGWVNFSPPWNGPVFTDLTQTPGFTSLTLASMSVEPLETYITPDCSWTADTLSINFNPTGSINYWSDANITEVWTFNFTTSAVPVPASVYLLGSGLIPLAWFRLRKRARK